MSLISNIISLQYYINRGTNLLMPYGDPFPQLTEMKGIAVELPLLRYKYVNARGSQSQITSSENKVSVLPSSEKFSRHAEPIRVNYTQTGPAAVSSLGIDPMVSSASVIHELAYGRISFKTQTPGSDREYPVPREYRRHDLDIIV